jgi:Nucleoside-diphosphate-sugar epimerases
MNILVVGGSGMIGGAIANHLSSKGETVTISGRNKVENSSSLASLPFLKGDFVGGTYTSEQISGFDAVVFSAGHDVRHVPNEVDFYNHSMLANTHKAPEFAELCKKSGVKKFINIGSFYPHIAPNLVDSNGYIRSRKEGSEKMLQLNSDTFTAISLDAPFVVGSVPGLKNQMFEMYVAYAQGKLEIPVFGPKGGTNFISNKSLAEAVYGALIRGKGGKAYLIGDQNLTFSEYFQLFFEAAGNNVPVPELDQEHPLLPDSAIFTGRGHYISYQADQAENNLLKYSQNDIARAVKEIVAQFSH